MGGGEVGLCSPMVHVPFGGSSEGARQSLGPARHQGGSSRVAILLVIGEDRLCRRGSTDGDSCVREDRRQVSSPPVDYLAG
jgi:hypothetical protein